MSTRVFGNSSARWIRLWFFCLFGGYNCSTEDGVCSFGTYANNTEPPVECLPCQACEQGQGIATACGGTNDTVCEDCTEDYYSKLTPTGRECFECESCGPQRSEVSPCTTSKNTICGSCAPGYFLYIDDGGSECKHCSRCPTDHIAVHWIECAEAGEPLNQQCAPGEWSESSPSYSPTPLPSSSVAQPVMAGRTRLPLSHGTFIPMASYEQKSSSPSQDDSTEKIAYVSIAFTAATFCVFLGASAIMFVRECTSNKKCGRGTSSTLTTTRTSSPIAESDEIAETKGTDMDNLSLISNSDGT